MSWVDMITMTIAAAAALECVAGRVAAMDMRRHRPAVIIAYTLTASFCILTASLIWQGHGLVVFDVVTIAIAGHLVMTWDDWRHGPPPITQRDAMQYLGRPLPSRADDGDRPM